MEADGTRISSNSNSPFLTSPGATSNSKSRNSRRQSKFDSRGSRTPGSSTQRSKNKARLANKVDGGDTNRNKKGDGKPAPGGVVVASEDSISRETIESRKAARNQQRETAVANAASNGSSGINPPPLVATEVAPTLEAATAPDIDELEAARQQRREEGRRKKREKDRNGK
mmetsp:Transcript_7467/g.17912  ORF Transcript_7467/g.17912 Transcript_7467/m.17912 type:complete len:170 (+) Transcript_7467:389-898(+)